MANNKRIQILRGTSENIEKNKEVELKDGQLIFNKNTHELKIGNGQNQKIKDAVDLTVANTNKMGNIYNSLFSICSNFDSFDNFNLKLTTLPNGEIYFVNNMYFGYEHGNQYDIINYSIDGINFNECSGLPVNETSFHIPIYFNNKWILICNTSTSAVRGIYYSNNGIAWLQTNITNDSIREHYNAIFINKDKIIVALSSGIYYSMDGIEWTKGTVPDNKILSNIYYIEFIDKFIGADGNLSNQYISVDGINWSIVSTGTAALNYTASDSKIIACNNLDFKYSTNGTTWNTCTGDIPTDYMCKYQNNKFIAGSSYSIDGITWKKLNRGTLADHTFGARAFKQNVFVQQDTTDNSLLYSYNGLDWHVSTLVLNSYEGVRGFDYFNKIYFLRTSRTTYFSVNLLDWNDLQAGSASEIFKDNKGRIYIGRYYAEPTFKFIDNLNFNIK